MLPISIPVPSLADLPAAAREVLAAISKSACTVVAFHGEMGAGKTTFIRTLAEALGVTDDVSSPTFAIVNEYRDGHDQPVYHFDFYRLDSVAEAEQMGAAEYFDSGYLCLVEWPARVAALLPAPHLAVHIEVLDTEAREIQVRIDK